MPEIAGAVESLEVFRVPGVTAHKLHIHWTATNGGKGCTVKEIPESQLRTSRYTTLARIGLSEQALTGDPWDSFDVKIVVNLQRTGGAAFGLEVPGKGPIEAFLSLPKGSASIPIPVYDREPPDDDERSANPRVLEAPEQGIPFTIRNEDGGRRV